MVTTSSLEILAPVVPRLNKAINWINLYTVDNAVSLAIM